MISIKFVFSQFVGMLYFSIVFHKNSMGVLSVEVGNSMYYVYCLRLELYSSITSVNAYGIDYSSGGNMSFLSHFEMRIWPFSRGILKKTH